MRNQYRLKVNCHFTFGKSRTKSNVSISHVTIAVKPIVLGRFTFVGPLTVLG